MTVKLTISLLLLASACTFKTDGLDDVMGTSCSHYVADTFTTEPSSRCWVADAGQCFFSEPGAGACHKPTQLFEPQAELVLWCPIGNPGEALGLWPADCR